MANVLVEIDSFIDGLKVAGKLPTTPGPTTYGTEVPDATITGLYVQYGWDGTPVDADNRESAALRLTVWAPLDQPTLAQSFASTLHDWVLNFWASPNLWRVSRGTGRLPGNDPDTDLPFCTFTVYPQLRATVPAAP